MFHVVFDRPEIPPNTGNAIRMVACTGAQLHLVEPLGYTLDDARLRRAGLDYHDLAAVHVHADLDRALAATSPGRVFAFTAAATTSYADIAYAAGDTLLFGPESVGLSAAALAHPQITEQVRIPMLPGRRSLNLSNAAAVAVYEAWRQLGFAEARCLGDAAVQTQWDQRYAERPQLWSGRPNGALVAEVAGLSPGRVLDVGCDEGADAVWLAGRGWDVTALEVSGVALHRAAQHARDAGVPVRWLHAELAHAQLPPRSFDLVSAQYPALLRTPDAAAERALLAAVAPGGVLLLVHHADMEDHHRHEAGDAEDRQSGHVGDHAAGVGEQRFDPADYVWPATVHALLDDDWRVEVYEQRARDVPDRGAGAHHTDDIVLRARRLR